MCIVRESLIDNKPSHSSTITTDHESGMVNFIKENTSSYDSREDMYVYETPREPTNLYYN